MITVVISEVNPGTAEGLRNELATQLGGQEEVQIVGYARDGLEVAQLAAQLRPDLIFVDEDLPGLNGYEACRLAAAAAPDTICILLAGPEGLKAPDKAMRAGARAVVKREIQGGELGQLVSQLAQLRDVKRSDQYAIVTDPTKMPVAVAVTSAKGGVGKTTTTVNLALLFAKRFPDQVALVDFFGQFGDCALALDLRPDHNIGDLTRFGQLDVDLVASHLAKHESGLRVLAGINKTHDAMMATVGVPLLAELFGLLRMRYRFVFFDLPPAMWTGNTYILSRCNHVVIMSNTLDLATMRDTTSLLESILATHIPRERVHLVVNRVSRQSQFTVKDLEDATGFEAACQIPDDPQLVMGSYNEGKPFVLSSPNAPVSQAVGKLAQRLLEGVAM